MARASLRRDTPNLVYRLETWVLTVLAETNSVAPMSAYVAPRASSPSTSLSRGLRAGPTSGAAASRCSCRSGVADSRLEMTSEWPVATSASSRVQAESPRASRRRSNHSMGLPCRDHPEEGPPVARAVGGPRRPPQPVQGSLGLTEAVEQLGRAGE